MFAKAKRLNVLKGRQIKRHSAAIVNLRRSDSQPKGSREKEIAIRDTLRQQLVDKRAVIARVESVLSKAVLALATGSELREPSHPLAVGRAAAAPSRQRYG